jgi:lysine 2,3-aminomutase
LFTLAKNDDKVAIDVKSQKLLNKLLLENPKLAKILRETENESDARERIKKCVMAQIKSHPNVLKYYECDDNEQKLELFKTLSWRDYASIRLLDYIENADREFVDLNLKGKTVKNNPIKLLWLAVNQGLGRAGPYFFEDMLHLFRQFTGENIRKKPKKEDVESWMDRYPSGLDPRVIRLRAENRNRIIKVIIELIDQGDISDIRFSFKPGMTQKSKFLKALKWWNDRAFHYEFAVRSPELLNRMLGYSLDPDTMDILNEAKKSGIPFFVNPYYLSLLQVHAPEFAIGADLAIRDYVIYSKELVEEFGDIVAWEKEDVVKPGKPNAAGWILPTRHNIHRRYPNVAILIPDSMGRACGGLCTTCQRMFVFQSGRLNFDLDQLKPHETWSQKLHRLMKYFEKDSQLRDILITGGDALMSSDSSLKKILNAVYHMAAEKKKANEERKEGEKYAEMLRVRLGSRLLAYLPQRIMPELIKILTDFRKKALTIGIKQFILQTHFESPMEVTPEAREAVKRLLSAGWLVTNQLVFTAAASRRGHTAKLRQVLNEIGILTYYTFSVKGYKENKYNFAPNARIVQEMIEEKKFGAIPEKHQETLTSFPLEVEKMIDNIAALREAENLPFLATDRSVVNIPGVGKSFTFRVIGITHDGRRILEFDHDFKRHHSPIIHKMGKVVVIESKSIGEFLKQLEDMGEDLSEYKNIYGYSMCETEERMPMYKYPEYEYKVTEEFTNLRID